MYFLKITSEHTRMRIHTETIPHLVPDIGECNHDDKICHCHHDGKVEVTGCSCNSYARRPFNIDLLFTIITSEL